VSILVFNAGSSTLKFALFGGKDHGELLNGSVDWAGAGDSKRATLSVNFCGQSAEKSEVAAADHGAAVEAILKSTAVSKAIGGWPVTAVGHRVVHGGPTFHDSVVIDPKIRALLQDLTALAPLHQPPALQTLDAAQKKLPNVPHIAVFDTAFFAGLPAAAHVYPGPYEWYKDFGIRRFGFHGISHSYCAKRAAELLKRDDARLVICHLGGGCSASAVKDGKPVATTMGFTPMEGLMMGKRSGSIDPGILIHLQRAHEFTAEKLDHALNHESGLLGVSGVSSDYRKVEEAAEAGNERAMLALEMFSDRVTSTIGALAAAMGGIDAVVFTAGIGENSARLRASVCARLGFLGLSLDESRNQKKNLEGNIATDASHLRALVIHTREEQMIAREALHLA
jgi:acetate kinase